MRAFYWLPLLTGVTAGTWEDVLAVLSARYGTWSREFLATRNESTEGEIVGDDSPFSVDELASLAPEEACRRISEWKPQQSEWMVSARGLSETLERVVINSPAQWVRHPLRIAMALRHPTYIHRYLVGILATLSDGGAPIEELIRLVALLRTHPWKADRISPDKFDYDTDWDNVDRTTIDIIERLAKNDIGFAGLSNEAWTILESAVKNRSELIAGAVRAQSDPLDIAINLPWTHALMAALEFIAYEFRSTNCVRLDAVRLLTETLRLEGDEGLYHRAIIAPNISLLQHVAPEWVERNRNLLLGAAAPPELGRRTLDQALKWAAPNRWLLEEFRLGVIDAIHRRVRNALDHYLIAMLWDWQGYSLEEAAGFLGSQPELLSATGDRLGSLLDSDSANQSHVERAVRFWRTVIDQSDCIEGLAGFGGIARVGRLDDVQWSDLTLKTLRRTDGRINEPHMVDERAAGLAPDDTTLEIMDYLVRKSSPRTQSVGVQDRAYYRSKWYQKKVEEAAIEVLKRSSDLIGSDHYRRLRTALRERDTALLHVA